VKRAIGISVTVNNQQPIHKFLREFTRRLPIHPPGTNR